MKVQRLPPTPKTPFHSPAHRMAAEAAAAEKSASEGPESPLEREFAVRWARLYPDLPFEREVVFLPPRRFRADFLFRDAKVVIEIQGQIWKLGGHTSGKGISRDCEKTFLSNCAGFVVFPLTPEMARDPETLAGIADLVRGRS